MILNALERFTIRFKSESSNYRHVCNFGTTYKDFNFVSFKISFITSFICCEKLICICGLFIIMKKQILESMMTEKPKRYMSKIKFACQSD